MDNQAYNTMIHRDHLADLLGQALIRDDLLPSILGNDSHEISYWAGKRLSRTHRLATYEDIETFFRQFKLGDLTLLKQTASQISWQLDGEIVSERLHLFSDPDFFLEAGFIAQSCQYILDQQAESEVEKINPAKGLVLITTYLSKDKPSDGQEAAEIFKLAADPNSTTSDDSAH
ncbi:hypothetical protein YK48G_00610 [Lentilactobacillus fungorum]|uniref:DUF2507 domain-containing protein n=1 Tax=Lentilactobacillus fungorum TaxID=2201250 RepID=A0ABQ3VW15_9LACO|nr:DUF2507 domain-containing protein [Lentilactobacillus fungorum]GHP12636.1 hypothetical protein YK48G_00610 [Lentilactobacillus fungorum]